MSLTQRLAAALAAALGLIAILALPGAAAAKDRNHDRIPDRWEKRHHLSTKVNQARRDQDHDHLRNRAEFEAGDNPRDPDSDDDGIEDGEENAGTIRSFDPESGRLAIDLFNGDTVSGTVTGDTEIKCERQGSASASRDGSDDDPGEEEEPGDDRGGDDSGQGAANSGPGRGDDEANQDCGTADLVAGAAVHEAELEVAGGKATFEEVELAG